MAMYLHIDGVDVYYDKINYIVLFTYFERYVSNHLVIYVIECMVFWSELPWLWCFLSNVNLVLKRFDSYVFI